MNILKELDQIWHFDPLFKFQSALTPPVCVCCVCVCAPQNSSKLVAALYLGPMYSLWAYTEGMVGLSFLVTATYSFDLAACARFGTLTLFEARLLLSCMWFGALSHSSRFVATLYVGPMKSIWAYTERMISLSLPFTANNSSYLAAWTRFGAFWPKRCGGPFSFPSWWPK